MFIKKCASLWIRIIVWDLYHMIREREILQRVTTFDFGSWDRRFILDAMRLGYLEIDSLSRFKHSPFFLAD